VCLELIQKLIEGETLGIKGNRELKPLGTKERKVYSKAPEKELSNPREAPESPNTLRE
jgi:hypothetical protein